MDIKKIKNTKEQTVLVACRIPKSDKKLLDKHKISFTIFAKEALKDLRKSL